MAELRKKPKRCECAVCGKEFLIYAKFSKRVTCSKECMRKYQGEMIHRGKSDAAPSAFITNTERDDLNKLLHEGIKIKNCQFCPLGMTYQKDKYGEYVCGRMKLEDYGMGKMYIKRPDRRCKANG